MRRSIAIFFLLIYLSTATEFHQLLRLPVFVVHYLEHKQLNSAVNLADFIALHYFNGDVGHGDSHDNQLPFKNHDCVEVTLSSVILPDACPEPHTSVIHIRTGSVFYSSPFFNSRFQFSIWQPPRA